MKSWEDAEAYCKARDGHLASSSSYEEFDFIDSISKEDFTYWIGGSDSTDEGVWKWNDGSEWNFEAWNTGEPNDWNGNEDCMTFKNKNPTSVWNDDVCTKTWAFICKKDPSGINNRINSSLCLTLQEGWRTHFLLINFILS